MNSNEKKSVDTEQPQGDPPSDSPAIQAPSRESPRKPSTDVEKGTGPDVDTDPLLERDSTKAWKPGSGETTQKSSDPGSNRGERSERADSSKPS
jgi:hypothetical protein